MRRDELVSLLVRQQVGKRQVLRYIVQAVSLVCSRAGRATEPCCEIRKRWRQGWCVKIVKGFAIGEQDIVVPGADWTLGCPIDLGRCRHKCVAIRRVFVDSFSIVGGLTQPVKCGFV